MLLGDIDRLVYSAEADQKANQNLGGERRVLNVGLDLGPKVGDRGLDVATDQRPEIGAEVAMGIFERRIALRLVATGKVFAIVGQLDRQGDRRRVFEQGGQADRCPQVGDVDVVGIIGEQPVSAGNHIGDRRRLGGGGLAASGDLGAEVGDEVGMKPADQAVGGPGADRVIGRQVVERG